MQKYMKYFLSKSDVSNLKFEICDYDNKDDNRQEIGITFACYFPLVYFLDKRTRFLKNLLGLCHRKTSFRCKLNTVCVISASVVFQCTITLFLMTLTLLTFSSNQFFSH